MQFTGEQIIFDKMRGNDIELLQKTIERYNWALPYCEDKIVADLGCGTGLGAFILSLVAKEVKMVDWQIQAIEYSRQLTFFCQAEPYIINLENEKPPFCEVAVAFDVIEHLNKPELMLTTLKAKLLLASIPLQAGTGEWHKINFTEDSARDLLKKTNWQIIEETQQITKAGKKGLLLKCVR